MLTLGHSCAERGNVPVAPSLRFTSSASYAAPVCSCICASLTVGCLFFSLVCQFFPPCDVWPQLAEFKNEAYFTHDLYGN